MFDVDSVLGEQVAVVVPLAAFLGSAAGTHEMVVRGG